MTRPRVTNITTISMVNINKIMTNMRLLWLYSIYTAELNHGKWEQMDMVNIPRIIRIPSTVSVKISIYTSWYIVQTRQPIGENVAFKFNVRGKMALRMIHERTGRFH